MRFKIEYALEPRIGAVFAQRLDECDFILTDGATLGGIPIKPEITMPRALAADGNPRLDLIASALVLRLTSSDLWLETSWNWSFLIHIRNPMARSG